MAIKSFRDRTTEALFRGQRPRRVGKDVARAAQRRLWFLADAVSLRDLSARGYRLHRLAGDREGQWSISVNDQFRICFRWEDGDAFDVELTDYH